MKRFLCTFSILLLFSIPGLVQAQIELIGSLSTPAHLAVDAVGTVAYAAGNNSFICVNLSDPDSIIGQASPSVGAISSVDVSGNYAYCAAGSVGLVVIRVQDPTVPTWVHNFAMPAPALYADAYDTLVAVATSANVSLVGCRSRSNPHILATYGHSANWVRMDYETRQIYVGSNSGAFSLNIVVSTSGGDTTFSLTLRNSYGTGECTPIALDQPFVDVVRGNILSCLNSGNMTQSGQYTSGGIIDAVAAGQGAVFIGISPATVQYLDHRTGTPVYVGSIGIPSVSKGIALAQVGSQKLVVVAHNTGLSIFQYSSLAVDPDPNSPAIPTEVSLEAYPNPFNSVAQIKISVPHAGDYKLKVFDVLGRTIIGRDLHLTNSDEISLDFSAFSAGTYYAEITGASGTARAKLLYLP